MCLERTSGLHRNTLDASRSLCRCIFPCSSTRWHQVASIAYLSRSIQHSVQPGRGDVHCMYRIPLYRLSLQPACSIVNAVWYNILDIFARGHLFRDYYSTKLVPFGAFDVTKGLNPPCTVRLWMVCVCVCVCVCSCSLDWTNSESETFSFSKTCRYITVTKIDDVTAWWRHSLWDAYIMT